MVIFQTFKYTVILILLSIPASSAFTYSGFSGMNSKWWDERNNVQLFSSDSNLIKLLKSKETKLYFILTPWNFLSTFINQCTLIAIKENHKVSDWNTIVIVVTRIRSTCRITKKIKFSTGTSCTYCTCFTMAKYHF